MPYQRNYPATVAEILDDSLTFKPAALRAVRAFARARPYWQIAARREELVRELCCQLSDAYGIRAPRLDIHWGSGSSGASFYHPFDHLIELRGRFSVVTFLHEFAHARRMDERQAVRWSVNLFRKCFPRSFTRCQQVGHTLIARGN